MTNATHTPGPWSYRHGDTRERPYVIGADFPGEGMICSMNPSRTPGLGNPSDWEANARLIAAAPDLLKAAKAALDACDTVAACSVTEAMDSAAKLLRSAIAKAEGGDA